MDAKLALAVVDIVRRAGDAILKVYQTDFGVETKADNSPLTQADLAAHNLIAAGLAKLTPDVPVLSEESIPPDYAERSRWQRYWLVDPLDGTKEFINRNGEFTVNVGLIEGNAVSFGVVGVPAQGLVYTGDVAARQAFRYGNDGAAPVQLSGRPMSDSRPLVIVASRSHGGERLERYLNGLEAQFGGLERTPVGSSLKLCILAEGRADLYPRLGPTCEWDIAAAHGVLAAAGGDVWAVDGSPMTYNAKESFLNPEFFAVADGLYDWRERLPTVPAQKD